MALGMELEYRLRWLDFDRYGRMQPAALLDLFQDFATIHANDMGIGRDDMLARDVVWVVVRTKLEVIRDAAYGSVVNVRTWPHTPTRFSFMRDFSLLDSAGSELVRATSEWVLMDVEARTIASVRDYYEGPMDFDEARAFEKKPRKLADFEKGNRPVLAIVPTATDIDVNGHVNNARYANYVMDALNPGEDEALRTFQIDYRHEALPGVPLAMHTLVEDGVVRSKGVDPDGVIAFAAAIDLR